MKKSVALIIIAVWSISVGIGAVWITDYSTRPGRAANSPPVLPFEFRGENQTNLPKLFVFLHPHCPCSRATLTELDRLVERNYELFDVRIFFYQPSDQPREWVESDLWRKAAEIPHVKLSTISEAELLKFGALTSGQTLLYDAQGNLVFSGGITFARGHEGDNAGSQMIEEFLRGKDTPFSETPVFGCILTGSEQKSN